MGDYMEHLVESHMGGYYISNNEPEVIMETCEECFDNDWILISYEEGKRFEALTEYFSTLKMDKEYLLENCKDYEKNTLISDLLFEYEKDRYMLNALCKDEIISKGEKKKLLKQIALTEKNQFEVLRELNLKGKTIKMIYKCNKKNSGQ